MTLQQRLEQAYRQLSDAQQLLAVLEGASGSVQYHSAVDDLSRLLNSVRSTLYLPPDRTVRVSSEVLADGATPHSHASNPLPARHDEVTSP